MKKVLLATGIVLILSGTAAAKEVNEGMCASYIKMYCSRCHSTKRICKALEKKDEEQWQQTITTMAGYGGLDQDTQDTTHACLSGMKVGDPIVCKKK